MRKPQTLNGVDVTYSASVSDLVAQLRPPTELSWAACIALGHNGTPEALDVLLGLVHDPDWCYRRASVEALASHPLAGTVAKQICLALGDSSPYVVRTACETVAALALRDAHDMVLGLTHSTSADTRQAAVRALSRIGRNDDHVRLMTIYVSDQVRAVRGEAAWALKANASQENWEPLFETWASDSVVRHRIWACELAMAFGGLSVHEQLVRLSHDANGYVRKAARRALNAR
jgi:HEAT repeat protein